MVEIVNLLKEIDRTIHDSETFHDGVVDWYDNRFGWINLARRKGDPGSIRVFLHLGAIQKSGVNPLDVKGSVKVQCTTTHKFPRPNPEVVFLRIISDR